MHAKLSSWQHSAAWARSRPASRLRLFTRQVDLQRQASKQVVDSAYSQAASHTPSQHEAGSKRQNI
jgi:hypothetical protein